MAFNRLQMMDQGLLPGAQGGGLATGQMPQFFQGNPVLQQVWQGFGNAFAGGAGGAGGAGSSTGGGSQREAALQLFPEGSGFMSQLLRHGLGQSQPQPQSQGGMLLPGGGWRRYGPGPQPAAPQGAPQGGNALAAPQLGLLGSAGRQRQSFNALANSNPGVDYPSPANRLLIGGGGRL